MYTLQSFFIPFDLSGINPDEVKSSEKKIHDFSFSESKPKFERSIIIGTKQNNIHQSRSKQIIGGGLKLRRTIFSDEKMMQSIRLLNKPVTPLKFEELSVDKKSESRLKMTSS